MLKRLVAAGLLVGAVFAFAGKVHAEDYLTVTYYAAGEESPRELRIGLVGEFGLEARAWFVFGNLLEDYCGVCPDNVPPGVRVLGLEILDGELTLDLSREVLGHGGGTAYESRLAAAFVENARQLEGVRAVTVLVEGQPADMPEGINMSGMAVR